MTQDASIIAAIDVGTTKVCTIIGRLTGSKGVEVLAHSVVPSEGLKKGNVQDASAAGSVVRESIRAAKQKAGVSVQSAYVGVAGAHISFENRQDVMEWAAKRGVITAHDLMQVPQTVSSNINEPGRRMIHAIPMAYSLDGEQGIRTPLGMHTRNLEVETHLVTGASSYLDKLVEAVENAGVQVKELVLEPLASSEAVLSLQEKERGVALVDIGGGTTDVVVFKNGSMCYTSVIPVGGYQFTNDICLTYNTPYEAAEAAKLEYAHTEPYVVRSLEKISLPVVGRTTETRVLRRDICQLVRERAQELVRLIKLYLREAGIEDVSNIPFVLTGGAAGLPGLDALMQRTLANRVRIGVPNGHRAVPNELRSPAHATSVGIFFWALKQNRTNTMSGTDDGNHHGNNGRDRLVTWWLRRVKKLSPMEILSN